MIFNLWTEPSSPTHFRIQGGQLEQDGGGRMDDWTEILVSNIGYPSLLHLFSHSLPLYLYNFILESLYHFYIRSLYPSFLLFFSHYLLLSYQSFDSSILKSFLHYIHISFPLPLLLSLSPSILVIIILSICRVDGSLVVPTKTTM